MEKIIPVFLHSAITGKLLFQQSYPQAWEKAISVDNSVQ
tara:strand:+ start:201 stop:317 length:117 start_codon:yes stop_codon:yes gene_type:complete